MREEKRNDAIEMECNKLARHIKLGLAETLEKNTFLSSTKNNLWIRLGESISHLRTIRIPGRFQMDSDERNVLYDIAGICIFLLCEDADGQYLERRHLYERNESSDDRCNWERL